jgi:MarR family transcriptional regulator, organic hydroperoxide resistance regulator
VRLSQSTSKALTSAPPNGEPLGDTLSFMQLLWSVAHGLESSSKRMHADLGVTGPQRLVLRIVGHYRRIAAGQLAEALRIHPSSLTGMLKRLEEAELLRREVDPLDRRRALLALTKRGQRLNDRREGTIEAVIAAALAKMPKERVTSTKTVLKAIAAALEAENEAQHG